MLYPYIVEGGLGWMLPLVILSFFSLGFCLERGWYWFCYGLRSRHRRDTLAKIYQAPFHSKKAFQHCQNSRDPLIQVLEEFLVHYDNVVLPIAERRARAKAEQEIARGRRFFEILALIANLSGTLGLLGTVVGISMSFKSVAASDPKAMALGMATAVYTTVAGLVLFLSAYLPLFLLQKMSERLDQTMEEQLESLRDFLEIEQKSRILFDEHSLQETPQPMEEDEDSPVREQVAEIALDPGEEETAIQILPDAKATLRKK